MEIASGYKTITPIQLANVVWALNDGHITAHALRVYLACFALVAIREAAARSRKKRRQKACERCRYREQEFERLTGLDAADVRCALRRLEAAQLVTFREGQIEIMREPLVSSEAWQEELACRRSPRRPIPVPRSLLRFLAQERSAALIQVALAYIARGLSIARRTGEINTKGTIKASWIAETFNLSRRAVKYSQAELRKLGWINKDTQSHQLKLNRHGAYFVINLNWSSDGKESSEGSVSAPTGPAPIVQWDKSDLNSAPLAPETAPSFAPPREDKETSYEEKQHQQTQSPEPPVSGIYSSEGAPHVQSELPPPSLNHIRVGDLCRVDRLEVLYGQAVARGWFMPSEAMALNFVGAAARARELGHEPARLFVALVQRGLWRHITQDQEDRARRALARYRELKPECFRREADRAILTVPRTALETPTNANSPMFA